MVLVIDNYDSFTYNLVQYLAELGAEVDVRRNDTLTVADVAALAPEAVVLSPGPGRPEDAGICVPLLRALGATVPVLGVCLGHQAIGLAYGGVVTLAPALMHGKTSAVRHFGDALYAGVPSPFVATRYHSLCVPREGLPEELAVTAETDDGVIMGLRHRTHPVHGVQFHPESILTADGKRILSNFLDEAGVRRSAGAAAGGGLAVTPALPSRAGAAASPPKGGGSALPSRAGAAASPPKGGVGGAAVPGAPDGRP